MRSAFKRTLALCVWMLPATGWAQYYSSHQIPYQGYLERNGSPEVNNQDMRFELFSSQSGGTCLPSASAECLWSEEQLAVPLTSGKFSVALGTNTSINDAIWQTGAIYLQVQVRESGSGASYVVLGGRQRILPVPMAAQSYATPVGGLATPLDIADANDPRVSFGPANMSCAVGQWCTQSGGWSPNRLGQDGAGTSCSGASTDCSSNYVQLSLPTNFYRTVFLSHLDWDNTGAIDVQVSYDGGATFGHHKRVRTYQPMPQAPYTSTIRTLATNLPIGADVVVRVQGYRGRIHFEGFGMSREIYPEEQQQRRARVVPDPTSCGWVNDVCEADGGDLVYLDRASNLSCPAGQVMTDWEVNNCGGAQFQMKFYCCGLEIEY